MVEILIDLTQHHPSMKWVFFLKSSFNLI
jgi:hypothetical protein